MYMFLIMLSSPSVLYIRTVKTSRKSNRENPQPLLASQTCTVQNFKLNFLARGNVHKLYVCTIHIQGVTTGNLPYPRYQGALALFVRVKVFLFIRKTPEAA